MRALLTPIFTVALLWGGHGLVAGQSADEHQLKAAFLFHLANFVSWPPDSADEATEPFVIGMLGSDPIESHLRALEEERIRGRRIQVKRFSSPESVGRAHILFMDEAQARHLPLLLAEAPPLNILTVGDSPGFTYDGGILRWLVEDDRLQVEVNLCAAERAGLTISSRLLRLATITVESCRGGGD